jgi:hypothetical protein
MIWTAAWVTLSYIMQERNVTSVVQMRLQMLHTFAGFSDVTKQNLLVFRSPVAVFSVKTVERKHVARERAPTRPQWGA